MEAHGGPAQGSAHGPRDRLCHCCLAIHRGELIFGALVLTAFEGLLRTGEMLGLCGSDLLIRNGQGLVRLADTKTSGRKGVTEMVTLHHPWVLMVLQTLLGYLQEKNLKFAKIWRGSPPTFRQRNGLKNIANSSSFNAAASGHIVLGAVARRIYFKSVFHMIWSLTQVAGVLSERLSCTLWMDSHDYRT